MKKYIIIISSLICSLLTNAQTAPQVFINIDPPATICNAGDAVILQTNFLQTYSTVTNNYVVNAIPYAPAFATTGGTLITTTNQDDVWSTTFNLPFPFCFYGQNYNSVLIGSNGVVHFPDGSEAPGGFCDYSFSQSLPNAGFSIKNAIYGVYQDTDIKTPPVTNGLIQNINFYITGTAPNRAFVANFNELPRFKCGSSALNDQTTQVILYETTNVIDVLVTRRIPCNSWQGGSGVIGVMNQTGTQATIPPGRNTGNWTANNEAWRFQPSSVGASNVTVEWFSGATSLGAGTSTGVGTNTLSVAPLVSTTYTTRATYIRCDGVPQVITSAPVTLNVEPPLPIPNPVALNICGVGPYTFNINQYPTIPSTDYIISYHTSLANAQARTPFIAAGSLAAYSSPGAGEQIWVRIEDNGAVGNGCINYRSFALNGLAAPSGAIAYSGTPYCAILATPQPMTGTITPGGVYSATPAGLSINITTGAINPSLSTAGTYAINYNLAASGGCPAYSSGPVSVTIDPSPVLTITNPAAVCQPSTVDITLPSVTVGSTGGATLSYWTDMAGTIPLPNPTAISVGGTYYIRSILGICSDIEPVVVTINTTPVLVITNPVAVCQPATVNITLPSVTVGSTGVGTLSYWTNMAGTIPLPNPTAIAVSGTYYIRSTSGTCSDIEAVVATISAPPVLTITNPAAVCQPSTVDITLPSVTVGSTGVGTLSYWTNMAGTIPLPNPTAIVASGTYYIRSTIGNCSDIEPVVVIINSLPVVPIIENGTVCVDNGVVLNTFILDSQLSSAIYTFQWYTVSSTGVQTPILGEIQSTFTVTLANQIGEEYGVIATTIATPNCSSLISTAYIGESTPPISMGIVTSNYFSELQTVTITVLPLGNYEYQLDNGPFQTSNVFTNVGSGAHSVTVRNECGVLPAPFTIIDYPKFFTPNGDGYHDTWNVFALSDQPNAKIYIFDRLGKLIKEIRASGEGWNGTFNGVELPSTNYWFTIQYSEENQNKEFRSHFALKR